MSIPLFLDDQAEFLRITTADFMKLTRYTNISITVRFHDTIYVLHAFQKKSKKGRTTPKKEIDLIQQRLAAAERDYKERKN